MYGLQEWGVHAWSMGATRRVNKVDIPVTLDDHPFYGLVLDEYQKAFRDAIWDPHKLIVFANAKSGTGKTIIATCTAHLLYEYGLYDEIVYIPSPTHEQWHGFLM